MHFGRPLEAELIGIDGEKETYRDWIPHTVTQFKISVITTAEQINEARVLLSENIIGFDSEWTSSFKGVPPTPQILQLSSLSCCFIFLLQVLKKEAKVEFTLFCKDLFK
jgi:hypothetical protein